MSDRRKDWIRLLTLLVLLVPAGIAGSSLEVDVENLSMKSVGTEADAAAGLRSREFGNEHTVVLLASPLAPDLLDRIDEREAEEWISGLRELEGVQALEVLPTQKAGERCISISIRADAEGRYAHEVEGLRRAAMQSLPPAYRLAVTGYPVVELAIAQALDAERERILPIVLATLGVLLFLIYRSPVLALGALLAPLAGVVLLEGVQALLGLELDPVSVLLGPAVLSVGVAAGVHVLESYRERLRHGLGVAAATRAMASQLRMPFLLTMATTVAGFLGLLASPIPAVRRFGALAALGTVLALGTTLICLPSLLRLFHRPERAGIPAPPRNRLKWAALLQRAAPGTLVAAGLLLSFGCLGLSSTRIDSDPLHVLPRGNPARRQAEVVARRLGGSARFELLLPPSVGTDAVSLPELVARVTSLAGVVGPAGFPRRSDSGYLLVPFLLSSGVAEAQAPVFAAAEGVAHELGWERAVATGLAVRVSRDSEALVDGQRKGIVLTLLGLWVVMAVGFRSLWLGLLGLLPNVLPVILIQATLGLIDRSLSVASSMIAVVMLGLVVDDTIHLLHAYRTSSGNPLRRTARSLARVGRPVVITTLVLCLGFSATLFGELEATREFGRVAVATLCVALLADLVFLPALLLWRDPGLSRIREFNPACLPNPNTTS